MSVDPVGASLGVIPLVGGAHKYWRNHNEVENLFRALAADIRKDARIPHGDREQVREQVARFRMDPMFLGGIKVYMENADLDAIPAIRARAVELLKVSPGVDVRRVVDLVVEAIERNVNRAFRADRDAAYHESRRSTKQITGTIESAEHRIAARIAEANPREDLASMSSKLANIERALTPAGAGAHTPLTGPERIMADLVESRPDDEPKVRELWESSTPPAIAALVTEPDAWLLGAHADVWLALARLLGHAGERATALVAYDEALHRGVGDRVRTLVRASSVARLDGQTERSSELLAKAIDENDQHPAVVLRTVEDADDEPADLLRRLAGFTSDDSGDLAIAEVLRGQAALLLHDDDEARRAVARALELDPGNLGALRLRGLAAFIPAQQRYAEGGRPDTDALEDALTDFTSARDRLREQRRYDESGHMAALITETHVILEDRQRAQAALQSPELLDEEARSVAAPNLARLAVLLGRSDLALDLVSDDATGDEAELVRAVALARGADRAAAAAGVARLTTVMATASDEAMRLFAAMALLIAASECADVAWNDEAGALIGEDDPVTAAVLRANHLRLDDRLDDAETELLAHSDHPGALDALVRIALEQKDLATAVQRVERLIGIAPADGDHHLLRAEVLVRDGQIDGAIQELLSTGKDDNFLPAVRTVAFARAADLVQERRDYASLLTIAGAWLEAFPDSEHAIWLSALALARLARHSDALEILEAGRLSVVTLDQAVVAAEIYYRAARVETSVREIARLSEHFAREDERLEFLVLLAALRREADLPAELADRVREGFSSFPVKFPDSKLMWVVTAPTTPEEVAAFVGEFVAPKSQAVAEITEQVRNGQAPVAALAAASARGVVESWTQLAALPLSFGNAVLDELERTDATEAVGKGAVWDPSALVVAAMLGGDLARTFRNALPTSQLPHAVLSDVDDAPLKESTDGEGRVQLGYDVDAGTPRMIETPPEVVSREQQLARETLDLARALASTYDVDADADDPWSKALRDTATRRQIATVAATFAVARRLGLPVYSDDRWIRIAARQEGLSAFGTLALLEVLPARLVDEDARGSARRTLLGAGAWGLRPSAEELITSACSAGWAVTPAVMGAFADPAAWAADQPATWRLAVDLLAAVHDAEPTKLRAWVGFVLEAASAAMPLVSAFQRVTSLLLTAWDLTSYSPAHSNAFFQALVREAKRLPLHLRPPPGTDIPLDVINVLLALTEGDDENERFAMFLVMIRRLGPFDLAEAWLRFVRH